jgi:hypothetical protein
MQGPASFFASSSASGKESRPPASRGIHSFIFQLNLSALYGIGGARRGCVARVEGVSGGAQGV